MGYWMQMTLVLTAVAGAAWYVWRSFKRSATPEAGGPACGSCGASGSCRASTKTPTL